MQQLDSLCCCVRMLGILVFIQMQVWLYIHMFTGNVVGSSF